jgi:hypothetical protein
MDARWPHWDTADSFAEGDEPATVQAWVPLYDDAALQQLRQECRRLRETLNFIATHFSSDWPERCQSNVLAARHVLAERPNVCAASVQQWRVALGACDAALAQCQPCADAECGAIQRDYIVTARAAAALLLRA